MSNRRPAPESASSIVRTGRPARAKSSDKPHPTETAGENSGNAELQKSPKYDSAVRAIRNFILSGEFDDQEEKQITEKAVMMKLESRGVMDIKDASVRRALLVLEHEGLVEIRAKAGTFVRTIDDAELGQLLRTRSVLEELFVCTCARDTSRFVNDQLAIARSINEQLQRRAESACADVEGTTTFSETMELDMQFHDAIAIGAGYKSLTEDLQSVRYRLRLARPYVKLTADSIRATAADHNAILESIRPNGPEWAGDSVQARLSIKAHLRNAMERLGISRDDIIHEEGYAYDPIMDAPSSVGKAKDNGDVHCGPLSSPFGVLRSLLEIVVAAELVGQKDACRRLSVPTKILDRMRDIALKCDGTDDIPHETRARFVNLDMQFHSTLAYTSGLLFAQDAITHVWQRMYNDAARNLGNSQMHVVIEEHEAILREITYFSQKPKAPVSTKEVLEQVRSHFVQAHLRVRATEKDKQIPGPVDAFLDWFIDNLSEASGGQGIQDRRRSRSS